MEKLHLFLATGLSGLLILLALTVAIKLLNGEIRTAGMLRAGTHAGIHPERLFVMIGTLAAAFGYLVYGLKTGAVPGKNGLELPPLPPDLISALGGGNVLYLVGKYLRK